MNNIVSLNGQPVPQAAEPVPSVVTMLENFLKLARSGELQGCVAVGIGSDRRTTYANFEGLTAWTLVGRIEAEKAKMLQFLAGDE